jgi:hypothetical protein
MASEIKAGNATDGLSVSSDNTGTLNIKTGTGAGTTAISIDASQNVAIPGTLTVGGIPSGGNYILTSYTSPSTWDATAAKAAGLKSVKITVVGAGGAGGGSTSSPTLNGPNGGGGGGGGSAITYLPAASITPGSKTVTAGTGANSFGPWGTATPFSPTATTTATAGSAGATPAAGGPEGPGGAGGAGSGGTINANGNAGGTGGQLFNGGGTGGSSAIFVNIVIGGSAAGGAGVSGITYGGGSGGAGARSAGTGSISGVAGFPGIVIIEEFY